MDFGIGLLKYMKKNELIEAYKYQDSQLQLNRKYSDEDMAKSKEYESKGELEHVS